MTDRSSTTIKSRHIATLNVKIGAQLQVGSVPVGIRLAIPITGGSVEGPILQGEVLPGGFDYPITVPMGSLLWRRDISSN